MITIDFDNYNERGFKAISTMFARSGLKVEQVEATNRARRESGFLVKAITYTFETGQKLVMKAKAKGSFYQIRLNNKVLPIKNVDNLTKTLKEIIAHVKGTEEAFLKAKKIKEEKAKIPTVPKVKRVNVGVKNQIEALQAQQEAIRETNAAMQAELSEAETGVTSLINAETELVAKLEALRAEGEILATELDELRKGVA